VALIRKLIHDLNRESPMRPTLMNAIFFVCHRMVQIGVQKGPIVLSLDSENVYYSYIPCTFVPRYGND
jgi:hypothetical protein